MMKKIALTLLSFATLTTYAQKSYTFKAEFKPNKTYIINSNGQVYNETNYETDEDTKEMMKSQGIDLPMVMEVETHMVAEITTLNKNKNGEIPNRIQIKKMSTHSKSMGEEMFDNQMEGVRIIGKYDKNNQFVVESIEGDKISEEMKKDLSTSFDIFPDQIDFPTKPMRVGETFTNESTVNYPIEGLGHMPIITRSEYHLSEIKNNKAYFNYKIDMSIDYKDGGDNMKAEGKGAGSLVYDLKEDFITETKSEIPMIFTIVADENLSISMKMVNSQQQTIEIK